MSLIRFLSLAKIVKKKETIPRTEYGTCCYLWDNSTVESLFVSLVGNLILLG